MRRRDTFFSPTYDLATSLQEQDKRAKGISRDTSCFSAGARADPLDVVQRTSGKFTWNNHLLKPFLAAGLSRFCVATVQGFAGQVSEDVAVGPKATPVVVTLLGRRDVDRAGTRHWRRGADMDGNAANFVESEMIVELPGLGIVQSFVQVRGSIPLAWSEVPNLRYKPRREQAPLVASQKAFAAHMGALVDSYQSVVAINLAGLGPKKSEGKLSKTFAELADWFAKKSGPRPGFELVEFDFHKQCGATKYHNLEKLFERIRPEFESIGAFRRSTPAMTGAPDGSREKVQYQSGVFRTNCIDSLDRTNVVQTMLAVHTLESLLQNLQMLRQPVSGGPAPSQTGAVLEEVFPALLWDLKRIWADHGDAVSKLYAGTGALKSGFVRTGKRSLSGFVDDGIKSVTRYVLNNFADGVKQDAIDLVLGHCDSTAAAPAGLGRVSLAPAAALLALALLAAGAKNGAPLLWGPAVAMDYRHGLRVASQPAFLRWAAAPLLAGAAILATLRTLGTLAVTRPALCMGRVQVWKSPTGKT